MTSALTPTVYTGHVFHVAGAADLAGAAAALVSLPDGALAVSAAGTVAWVGDRGDLPAELAGWPRVAAGFILPGFVDTHLHFPQTYETDAYGGGQLLEWLERCIFPAESRFADPTFAGRAAQDFVRRRVSVGTTAAVVFGSAFPVAQDALFAASAAAGLRMVSGRGIQTVGSPAAAALLTGEDRALELVDAEIARWHGRDSADAGAAPAADPRSALLQVAVVPRFSLSVTARTLVDLGELYDDVRGRGVYFHSHLSENDRPGTGEVTAVREAYGVQDYLDTYDGRFRPGSQVGGKSLLGRRSILAHAVHCTAAELARMAETQTSIAHCPTSQQFLGSGTMPWRRVTGAGVHVAVGTDIGAGDEWLIPRVLNDTYKVHLSEPGADSVALHPAQLLYLGTLAGAQALDQDERFGNFDLGKDADFLLVDPDRYEPLALTLRGADRAEDATAAGEQILFALLLGLREPALSAVHIRGLPVRPVPLEGATETPGIGRTHPA
ncbi:MAG: guanine deaminase [Friedmanniella sp.]|nr:guanine deaminase [Friedmanniella sp.]